MAWARRGAKYAKFSSIGMEGIVHAAIIRSERTREADGRCMKKSQSPMQANWITRSMVVSDQW